MSARPSSPPKPAQAKGRQAPNTFFLFEGSQDHGLGKPPFAPPSPFQPTSILQIIICLAASFVPHATGSIPWSGRSLLELVRTEFPSRGRSVNMNLSPNGTRHSANLIRRPGAQQARWHLLWRLRTSLNVWKRRCISATVLLYCMRHVTHLRIRVEEARVQNFCGL